MKAIILAAALLGSTPAFADDTLFQGNDPTSVRLNLDMACIKKWNAITDEENAYRVKAAEYNVAYEHVTAYYPMPPGTPVLNLLMHIHPEDRESLRAAAENLAPIDNSILMHALEAKAMNCPGDKLKLDKYIDTFTAEAKLMGFVAGYLQGP
jgi:hypothetical protein